MTIVAVYGTLKRGHGNNVLLQRESTEYLGVGVLKDEGFHLFGTSGGGGFPVLMRTSETGGEDYQTVVEVYKVDDDTLKSLDRLESNGRMYQREPLLFKMHDEDRVRAQTYIGCPDFWEDHIHNLGSAEVVDDTRQVWY